MFETERKFLVSQPIEHLVEKKVDIVQGYLFAEHESHEFRIRISADKAKITIKEKHAAITRSELEFNITVDFASHFLSLIDSNEIIKKQRYYINHNGKEWSIDDFEDPKLNFLLAEVELECCTEELDLPEWVGDEVTGDSKYYNYNLRKVK
ncbi:CYTH domain-containing protein [Halomonas sp. ISL-60]|uniref:CYTH domain-containing protein n=1 Tax=Halomonas sp. ISL-56 TaxID=2819149 RepID=UPI001BED3C4B|nr:CYTH domain-containing protein [Halomonas sp. ISL-56]MBT2772745.1 CYTH domain-containing protein [Halomonas sp. ISL-60]MBT2800540.1 CYTH domain-containing protein [Halomonas sp. ISL-56]